MTKDQIARVERLIARMEPSTCPLSLDARGRPFPPSPVADHEAAERAADRLALRALLTAYQEGRQELARIDAVMAGRPALDKPTRWQNIEHACSTAGRMTDRVTERERQLATALRLAKEATNGWACYAKRDIEHREIARLHLAIDVIGTTLAVRNATDRTAPFRGPLPQPDTHGGCE